MDQPQDLWGERSRLRPRQLLFDLAVAAAFTVLALAASASQPTLLVVASGAMGLALAVRRVSWPLMVVLAVATGVLQLVAGELTLVADVGYAPVCFVLGAHPRAWVRRLGLAGVVVAAMVLATGVGTGLVGDAAIGKLDGVRGPGLGRAGHPGGRRGVGGRLRAVAEAVPHLRPGAGRAWSRSAPASPPTCTTWSPTPGP